MGFYAERVFPWMADVAMSSGRISELRDEALASARGRVIEIGFGTGLNLAHYPEAVTHVVGVEPSGGMTARAAARVASAGRPVEIVGVAGESIPLPDASFDTAVSTYTLCTVDDPAKVLAELRRLLAPGGRFLFLEHGRADDARTAWWQDQFDGAQQVIACGCHLNRDVRAMVEGNGFRVETIRSFHARPSPKTHGWMTMGVATPA